MYAVDLAVFSTGFSAFMQITGVPASSRTLPPVGAEQLGRLVLRLARRGGAPVLTLARAKLRDDEQAGWPGLPRSYGYRPGFQRHAFQRVRRGEEDQRRAVPALDHLWVGRDAHDRAFRANHARTCLQVASASSQIDFRKPIRALVRSENARSNGLIPSTDTGRPRRTWRRSRGGRSRRRPWPRRAPGATARR